MMLKEKSQKPTKKQLLKNLTLKELKQVNGGCRSQVLFFNGEFEEL